MTTKDPSEALSPHARRLARAQACWERHAGEVHGMLWGFGVFLDNERYPEAAFHLHQAAESCYKAVLRICQDDRPGALEEEHDLERLAQACGALHPALRAAWPRNTPADEARFRQLQAAYEDARFSKKYRIARDDLLILAAQVSALRELAERICRTCLDNLAGTA